ncbi:MAG: pyridoxamine 5'-phosphate oxidase family protein [Pseudomonadota bacterium]
MDYLTKITDLEHIYGAPSEKSLTKVAQRVTPLYQRWIEKSRFAVLTTVGPEGTDASPRGDKGPVVKIVDDKTLFLPDWRGNNRLDSLRNILRDHRVSLMFMVPHCDNVVRVNGTAKLTADAGVTKSFAKGMRAPLTVIVITVQELYFQCAKAIMRSELWRSPAGQSDLPTAGDFLKEVNAEFDGQLYDKEYPDYAKSRMW